jgi:hypothetical protein
LHMTNWLRPVRLWPIGRSGMVEIGWGNPRPFDTRSKFHFYAEDGRSLCGKWARFTGQPEVETGMDDHSDNCAKCKRRKAKVDAS